MLGSLWDATAAEVAAYEPLDGAHSVQVAIVGAGYAGLSTAIALADRGVDVAVFEMHHRDGEHRDATAASSSRR